MYIYGTSQIHAAQPINAPHRMSPTQGAGNVSSFRGVDQLDISPEADFVAQARDLPEIREDRVAALKAIVTDLRPVSAALQSDAPADDSPMQLGVAIRKMLLAISGSRTAADQKEPILAEIEKAIQKNKDLQ